MFAKIISLVMILHLLYLYFLVLIGTNIIYQCLGAAFVQPLDIVCNNTLVELEIVPANFNIAGVVSFSTRMYSYKGKDGLLIILFKLPPFIIIN